MIIGIFKSKLHAQTVQRSQQMSKFCFKSNISRRCKRSNVLRCVIASFVDTYIVIRHVRWPIKPTRGRLPSALPRERPGRQLSVTRDAKVSCIKDGCKTKQMPTLRFTAWDIGLAESRKNWHKLPGSGSGHILK